MLFFISFLNFLFYSLTDDYNAQLFYVFCNRAV